MNIKRDKTYQARMDGLKYALEIVERGGIEELKKEIRVRNAQFIPLEVSAKKANEISQVLAHRILATFDAAETVKSRIAKNEALEKKLKQMIAEETR